jgi:hypothetical protein
MFSSGLGKIGIRRAKTAIVMPFGPRIERRGRFKLMCPSQPSPAAAHRYVFIKEGYKTLPLKGKEQIESRPDTFRVTLRKPAPCGLVSIPTKAWAQRQ